MFSTRWVRMREENGYRFNERWLYEHLRDDPAGVPMRVVYWHRYDFVATMVRANDKESWRSDETLVQALKDHASRLAPLDPTKNEPVTPSNRHRPVSDFKGKADLGGRMQ